MLKFIGAGSAFNTSLGNNSAFIKRDDTMLLIDCGGTVFHRLMELDLLKDVTKLHIIITHTHPDHVGSLGEVIFYAHYLLKIKPTLYFPDKALMESFLASIGVPSSMYYLEHGLVARFQEDMLEVSDLEFMPVTHVNTIPAWGFILKLRGERIYYSGDANAISPQVLEKLISGKIDRIYQDTCGLDYDGNVHMSLRKLSDVIPLEIRNKVYCMHYDKHISLSEIKEKGFNTVDVYRP